MTPLEVIEREKSCVLRQGTADCDRDCKNCDLVLPTDEVVKAYDYVTEHIRACERIIDSAHKCNDEYRLQTLELRQENEELQKKWLEESWERTKLTATLREFTSYGAEIKDLRQENARLGYEVAGLLKKKGELTEKNVKLKEKLECAEHNCKVLRERNDNQYNAVMEFREKAKEIISVFLKYDGCDSFDPDSSEYEEYVGNKKRAEDFLKDVL